MGEETKAEEDKVWHRELLLALDFFDFDLSV